uniref:Ferrochelatase n=1 Tax=Parastrongyloides trichosuri TaxID=131310 RepID=A0A0N4ZE78_PARTI
MLWAGAPVQIRRPWIHPQRRPEASQSLTGVSRLIPMTHTPARARLRPAGRAGGVHRPLSEDAAGRRRPGAEDLRELGRGPARRSVRDPGAEAASEAGRPRPRAGRHRAPDRLPEGLGGPGRTLCARMRRAGRGAGHRLSAGRRPARPEDQAHSGRAGPSAAARRRRGAGPPRRSADGGLGPGAVDFQPRPRHPAGCAHRPCRASAETDRRPMNQTAATLEGRSGRRVAVVLTNLGGPDRPEAVKPFLFNLFNDPAIIGLPGI